MWKTGLRAPVSSVEIGGRNVEKNRRSIWMLSNGDARPVELALDDDDERDARPQHVERNSDLNHRANP